MIRRIACIALAAALALPLAACAPKTPGTRVLCSFYPLYAMTLNIVTGVQDIEVECLAPPQSGCLDEYQLTVADRRRIADADVFVANGLSLEPFMDTLKGEKDLFIADVSERLDYALLPWASHHDGESEEAHEHGEYNPHVWVSPYGAAAQAVSLGEALAAYDAANADQYRKNASAYADELRALGDNAKPKFADLKSKVATFHDAYPYLARDMGVEVAFSVSGETIEQVSAKELANVIEAVKSGEITALLSEEGVPQGMLDTIKRETGLAAVPLSPLTNFKADGVARLFQERMEGNLSAFAHALDPSR